jgi:hypothetical protein
VFATISQFVGGARRVRSVLFSAHLYCNVTIQVRCGQSVPTIRMLPFDTTQYSRQLKECQSSKRRMAGRSSCVPVVGNRQWHANYKQIPDLNITCSSLHI